MSPNSNVLQPMDREPHGLEDGLRHDKWACMMWPRLPRNPRRVGRAGMDRCCCVKHKIRRRLGLSQPEAGEAGRV